MLKGICLGIFVSLVVNSKGQDTTHRHPKPYMWIDKYRSIQREASYNLKHYLMSQYSGIDQTDSIYYPDFFEMIKYFISKYKNQFVYLRVYIAAYPPNDPMVPKNWGKKLTLIFAPADKDCKDIPDAYYTIQPNGNFDAINGKINTTKMKIWTRRYINKLMPSILGTIDSDDEDNLIGEEILSDTRSITYPASNIKELLGELTRDSHRRAGEPVAIAGVKAFFAAYTNQGNEDEKNIYRNRLHIEFEFTDKDGNIIYLDDDVEDQFKDGKIHPQPIITDCFGKKGINNGQLCPANCP